MSLRFMQVFVPDGSDLNVNELLIGCDVLATWRDAANDKRIGILLLAPAEEAEPIMDRLEKSFAGTDGFRVILSAVEAAIPRPIKVVEAKDEPADPVKESSRIGREELYSDISETLSIDRVFFAMTILSSIVAAIGLMKNDVAVIIGAMVIAPLLGPNVAMALSTTLGDLSLLRRALVTNIVGITLSFVVSVFIGFVFPVDPQVPAIASRSSFAISDLVLALAAGSAGTFAFTRGMASTVIGVMVAVALMPPLVAMGLLLSSGHYSLSFGALTLLIGNVIAINLAGVATFVAQGVRPRTWWDAKLASKATIIAMITWVLLLVLLGGVVLIAQKLQISPSPNLLLK